MKIPLWVIDVGAEPGDHAGVKAGIDGVPDAAIQVSGTLRLRAATIADAIGPAKTVATLLASAQYLVTLVWPDLSPDRPPLGTRHDRGVVLVPAWSWR